MWITLLIDRGGRRAKLDKSRAWRRGPGSVQFWNMSKINGLAALLISEQGPRPAAGLVAPQHGFCAQVKAAGSNFAVHVS
jgi:hypothetical protein